MIVSVLRAIAALAACLFATIPHIARAEPDCPTHEDLKTGISITQHFPEDLTVTLYIRVAGDGMIEIMEERVSPIIDGTPGFALLWPAHRPALTWISPDVVGVYEYQSDNASKNIRDLQDGDVVSYDYSYRGTENGEMSEVQKFRRRFEVMGTTTVTIGVCPYEAQLINDQISHYDGEKYEMLYVEFGTLIPELEYFQTGYAAQHIIDGNKSVKTLPEKQDFLTRPENWERYFN